MAKRKEIRLLTDSFVNKQAALREAAKARRFSDREKIEAVKTYLALGCNGRLTCKTLKISYDTFNSWKTKKWFQDMVGEIKKQEKLELSARLQKIVGKALEELEDRVQGGDFVLNQKTGELIRKPLTARDLTMVTDSAMNRREIIEKQTEERAEHLSNEEKLQALAERFAQLAAKVIEKPPVNVTDVVFIEKSEEQSDA